MTPHASRAEEKEKQKFAIKALEWQQVIDGRYREGVRPGCYSAEYYRIKPAADGTFLLDDRRFTFIGQRFRNEAEAMLAAQSHYEARTRSAIVETPQPVAVPDEAWTILGETPDITSPEEYPYRALITMEQLAGFMQRATPQPPAVDDGWRTMDSAPKDGRRILAWSPDWTGPSTAQWYPQSGWKLDFDLPPFHHQPTR